MSTPAARARAEQLVKSLGGYFCRCQRSGGWCESCQERVNLILAYADEVRREERERILGPACPCKWRDASWHQRGVCRDGMEALMQSITKPADQAEGTEE